MTAMYERTSGRITMAELPEQMRSAIAAHADGRQLVIDPASPVWLHHSVNRPSSSAVGRLLGRRANSADPDAEHDVAVVLHRTHVLITTAGARRGVAVLSLPLVQASVSPGTRVQLPGAGVDAGFSISGFPGDEGRPGSFFIGVGPEPAGTECQEAVRTAVTAAKNP